MNAVGVFCSQPLRGKRAVAKSAGIPNPVRDGQFSNVTAVAQALGLRLELVEERV